MSHSLRRRWALSLVRCAARLLPRDRASWGEAMCSEVQHIDGDRAALRWAVGALLASGTERAAALLDTGIATWGLALLTLCQALGMFFAPILIIAWRVRWLRIDDLLGGLLPGDHYPRFIPLMNATPSWQLALWIAAGLLFLAATWRLARARHGAFALFATALALTYTVSGVAWMERATHPALAELYRRTYAFPRPAFRRDVLVPLALQLLPLLAATALWWRDRSQPRSSA